MISIKFSNISIVGSFIDQIEIIVLYQNSGILNQLKPKRSKFNEKWVDFE